MNNPSKQIVIVILNHSLNKGITIDTDKSDHFFFHYFFRVSQSENLHLLLVWETFRISEQSGMWTSHSWWLRMWTALNDVDDSERHRMWIWQVHSVVILSSFIENIIDSYRKCKIRDAIGEMKKDNKRITIHSIHLTWLNFIRLPFDGLLVKVS